MPRPDLLALTADDLAALTNRGTVKRAERELAEGEVTGTVTIAPDGQTSVTWSDGPECVIPAGRPLAEGRCSCAAIGLCRHLVRTVLAVQKSAAVPGGATTDSPVPTDPPRPWNPGDITDDALAGVFRPQQLSKARASFAKGVLAEIVRSTKPVVRLFEPSAVVRFLVPNDVRYTRCDCPDPAPCGHVPLAVWACRELPTDRLAGVVAVGGRPQPVPDDWQAETAAVVDEALSAGLSGVAPTWADRVTRLEARTTALGWPWPAEVLRELAIEYGRYTSQDALFAPDKVARLVGELLVRHDAMTTDTGRLPQQLVRGVPTDTAGPIGKSRYIGLGCGVRRRRSTTEILAYLQDLSTATVCVVTREFSDAEKPFTDLGRGAAASGLSLADLGRGQLLIESAKRTAGLRLILARAKAALQPQAFAWENLKPPVAVEDYGELAARLTALPPSAVRPRRPGEDLFVLPVASVSAAGFDARTQTIIADLLGPDGIPARLEHPYTTRGRAGSEALLAALTEPTFTLKFVAGTVRRTVDRCIVRPTSCVFDTPAGRIGCMPWVDPHTGPIVDRSTGTTADRGDPLRDGLTELEERLQDILMVGLRRQSPDAAKTWQRLDEHFSQIGCVRLAGLVRIVADELKLKTRQTAWDPRTALAAVSVLFALMRLAPDVGGFG